MEISFEVDFIYVSEPDENEPSPTADDVEGVILAALNSPTGPWYFPSVSNVRVRQL